MPKRQITEGKNRVAAACNAGGAVGGAAAFTVLLWLRSRTFWRGSSCAAGLFAVAAGANH